MKISFLVPHEVKRMATFSRPQMTTRSVRAKSDNLTTRAKSAAAPAWSPACARKRARSASIRAPSRNFVRCGIGIAKGNEALRIKLNGVIKELNASGVIDKAWVKGFGGPMLHDPKSSPLWNS